MILYTHTHTHTHGYFNRQEIKWLKLSEACKKLFAGGDVPKENIKSKKPKGEYIYPIISNGIGENAIYGYSKICRVNEKAVTISARGTIGYHTIVEKNFTPIVRLIVLIPNEKILCVKYLNYILYKVKFNESGAGIKQLTIPNIKDIIIPIPPLSVQEQIVSILERFENLCNDISGGLPTEIKMRQEQYEYYRDKLLTFKEKRSE